MVPHNSTCNKLFLTKTIDDVPDDDGEHYLVLPVLPGHKVADQTHPEPTDELL